MIAVLGALLSATLISGPSKGFEEKEAYVWYLGHSGWAIETPNHFLIFDYWERREPSEAPVLANGHIDPEEIKDHSVIVFISHGHRDHFDPLILEWRQTIPDITYVFGWKADKGPDYITCDFEREELDIDGVKVRTIVHDFDGIPESAFLVELDGITLFHSGDHGNGPPPFKDAFVDNLEYIHKLAPQIDLAFIPLWGEESFVIQRLEPKYTFPMHDLGAEHRYEQFAEKAKAEKLPTKVICAEQKGDRFFYAKGKMKKK